MRRINRNPFEVLFALYAVFRSTESRCVDDKHVNVYVSICEMLFNMLFCFLFVP